jgi:threonyl-tRNA synthetase
MFTLPLEEEDEYVLKPMNCPGHVVIYRSQLRSYRDLPVRMAELGTVYRYERSGVLHGLMRVRGFTQDDAHIFCTPEQLEDEIVGVLDMTEELLRTFGFEEWRAVLSVGDPDHPEDYAGEPREWQEAEAALEAAAARKGLEAKRMEGEAVFYGPKIDVMVVDAIGRDWQLSTVQFDFNLPSRFDISYMGADGREHRPYMVHRAIFGSLERFLGILIEHYAGAFPAWLAPVQAKALSITDDQASYVHEVVGKLREAGLRAEADVRSDKVGKKVAEAVTSKVPWILVCGKREVEAGNASLRTYEGGEKGAVSIGAFCEEALQVVRERRLTTE